MDSIQRLIAALLLAFVFTPVSSFAIGTVPKIDGGSIPGFCFSTTVITSANQNSDAECAATQASTRAGAAAKDPPYLYALFAGAAWFYGSAGCTPYNVVAGTAAEPTVISVNYDGQSAAGCQAYQTGNRNVYAVTISTAASCPANASLTGSVCTCNLGFRTDTKLPSGASCVAVDCPAGPMGPEVFGPFVTKPALGDRYVCDTEGARMGCAQKFVTTMSGLGPAGWFLWGDLSVTGQACQGGGSWDPAVTPSPGAPVPTTGADTPDTLPPLPCPVGQCPGTVNGAPVCVACSATSTGTTSSTSSGGTTSTTTSETTCSGTNCTTTTTTKDGSGTVTSSGTSTTTQDKFCIDNPDTTICQKSTFGAACGSNTAAVTCSGDAIQCAIASEQARRNCSLFESTGPVRTVGEEALARGDTRAADHPGAAGNVTTTAVGAAMDSTDLVVGSCPADQAVPMPSGGSLLMPWSKVCTPASWLGNLLVGLTSLAWVFIAFKRG